jgi:hypothetical protein
MVTVASALWGQSTYQAPMLRMPMGNLGLECSEDHWRSNLEYERTAMGNHPSHFDGLQEQGAFRCTALSRLRMQIGPRPEAI